MIKKVYYIFFILGILSFAREFVILMGIRFFVFWPVKPDYHFEVYCYPELVIILILTILCVGKWIKLDSYIAQMIFHILSLILFCLRIRWI